MPTEDELPKPLKALARRQALELDNKNYDYSTRDLLNALESYLGKPRNRKSAKQKNPWYLSLPFLVLSLTTFFPAGLFFLIFSNYPFKTKFITGIFGLFFFLIWVGLITDDDSNTNNPNNNITTKIGQSSNNTEETSQIDGSVNTPKVKAGFDCETAYTKVEKAICSYSQTREIDLQLNETYTQYKNQLPPIVSNKGRKQQSTWIKSRNQYIENNCLNKSDIANCITAYYQKRISTIKELINTSFTDVLVIDPSSNIRKIPNGEKICQVTNQQYISIYNTPQIDQKQGLWYWTEYCGRGNWGVINESQIKMY